MKKLITMLSAMLIVAGLKAQKTAVQKETVKPAADTLIKKSVPVNSNTATQALKKTQKDVKLAPAVKYAPAFKKAVPATKEFKKATIEQ